MRVASVNQDAGIGPAREKGAAVHLAALRTALSELGADVLPLDEPDDGRLLAQLAAARVDRGLDLVYERYALGRTAACRFALEHGLPFALEVNAPLVEEARRYRGRAADPADERAEELLFSSASCVYAVSEPLARHARERGARRVEVCPNGVDAQRFRPRADDGLRSELVPPGRVAVGFHGRLRPWHGFELLAGALARALRAGAPLHLVTAGVGDFAGALADRVPSAAHTHFDWVPHDEVARVVACFDVLPLAYPPDAPLYFSPLKLAEGMAVGAVPVAPDAGDWCRLLEHRRNALLYPLGDERALADALGELARDAHLRARLGAAARETALGLSWRSVAERVLGLAREPLAGARGAGR